MDRTDVMCSQKDVNSRIALHKAVLAVSEGSWLRHRPSQVRTYRNSHSKRY